MMKYEYSYKRSIRLMQKRLMHGSVKSSCVPDGRGDSLRLCNVWDDPHYHHVTCGCQRGRTGTPVIMWPALMTHALQQCVVIRSWSPEITAQTHWPHATKNNTDKIPPLCVCVCVCVWLTCVFSSPQRLTACLISAAFFGSVGSSFLYGYNLSVVNAPASVSPALNSHCITELISRRLTDGD